MAPLPHWSLKPSARLVSDGGNKPQKPFFNNLQVPKQSYLHEKNSGICTKYIAMSQDSVFKSPLIALILVLFTGVFAAWLWFFHPSCYGPVVRFEPQTSTVFDTIWAPAAYRIDEIFSSDIQVGKRPKQAEGILENIEKLWYDATQKEYTEQCSYVLQSVRFQNASMDTATFSTRGWLRINTAPSIPIETAPEKVRLAPGEFFTFHFRLDLPTGYDLQIIDFLREGNCRFEASPARTIRKREVTTMVARKVQCNHCCEVCEDEAKQTTPLKASSAVSKSIIPAQ